MIRKWKMTVLALMAAAGIMSGCGNGDGGGNGAAGSRPETENAGAESTETVIVIGQPAGTEADAGIPTAGKDDMTGKDETSGEDGTAGKGAAAGKNETAGDDRAKADGDLPSDFPGRQIPDQSFDVTLDGWGPVTFASFMPKEYDSGDGDVNFGLLKNGEVVYLFPGISEDNRRFNQQFEQIAAVAFKDFYGDGGTDIIVIIEYAPLSGSDTDRGYHEARVYTQKAGSKEFVIDHQLDEFLMKNHKNDSVASVMEAREDYKVYLDTMDRAKSVQEQIEIMASNKDLWFENPDYASEVYRFAVTDLDGNGRLEVISSILGGTGLYTYSRFFEINESFTGLEECGTNFLEGDSQPDIMADSAAVYYEKDADTYYYIFYDLMRNGAAELYEGTAAISLKNGEITDIPLALKSTIHSESGTKITYTDAAQKEISESEYLSAAEKRFGAYPEYTAFFGWMNMEELVSLDKKGIEAKLYESCSKFEIRE